MTDDARARALDENARRSRVMAEAQQFGPPAPRASGIEGDLRSPPMASRTEEFVRYKMAPAVRRQYQSIAIRILAEAGGRAPITHIRSAIQARHPDRTWDRRYPLTVLRDNGVLDYDRTDAWLVEHLDEQQIADLLRALDERAVRTTGLRVEDTSWRPDAPEWARLRGLVVERDGEGCSIKGCEVTQGLQLDHIWRGSLLSAVGWSPRAINDPTNLELLCPDHHRDKTMHEARLLASVPEDEDEISRDPEAASDEDPPVASSSIERSPT